MVSGTKSCGGDSDGDSSVRVSFTIYRRDSVIVFETEPQEALPDVWFENDQSYSIDSSGNHSGNVTNQNITNGVAGVVNTGFFNCYAFGNGVESYKIRDSLTGKSFNLGNRVFTTSNIDYKEAHRFADLTYSGVYRETSGINNLNEFNLSLSNFKYLDKSFGSIQKIKSRDTDLVVFQEDKVSKILYGKNLLSDAVGGGSIASIPEVLGTQISFSGQYGISKNPESFAQWGNNMYFTDEFRGAVCRLSGNGIFEISSFGMADWFKDLFRDYPGKRKLGGIDPFKGRYVLSSRDIAFPTITNITYTRT